MSRVHSEIEADVCITTIPNVFADNLFQVFVSFHVLSENFDKLFCIPTHSKDGVCLTFVIIKCFGFF